MSSFYGREEFLQSYVRMVSEKSANHFLLTGKWGSGKSTLVKEMVYEINLMNGGQNNTNAKAIIIDAWENDYLKDPNLLILNELMTNNLIKEDEFKGIATTEISSQRIVSCLSEIGNGYFEHITGINIKDGAETFISDERKVYDSSLSELSWANYYKSMTEKVISKAMAEKYDSLVIFVDEIDRCKPDFALRLIEKLHHLELEGNSVKFVYVSDKTALIDIVNNYYGFGSRSSEYLEKMFDLTTELPILDQYNIGKYFASKSGKEGEYQRNDLIGRMRYEQIVNFLYENDFTFRNINIFVEDIINTKFSQIENGLRSNLNEIIFDSKSKDDYLGGNLNFHNHPENLISLYYQVLVLLQTSSPYYQIGVRSNWVSDIYYQSKLITDLYEFIDQMVPVIDNFFNKVTYDAEGANCTIVTSRLGLNELAEKEKKQKQELFAVLNRLIRGDSNFSNYIY